AHDNRREAPRGGRVGVATGAVCSSGVGLLCSQRTGHADGGQREAQHGMPHQETCRDHAVQYRSVSETYRTTSPGVNVRMTIRTAQSGAGSSAAALSTSAALSITAPIRQPIAPVISHRIARVVIVALVGAAGGRP